MYYYTTKKNKCEDIENKTLPNMNDVVFGEITHFSGKNAYCKLLEYNSQEGFIPNTELDKHAKGDPLKQFEIGKIYPLVVIGFRELDVGQSVDLSYKKVQKDTRNDLLIKFGNVNKLYTIINEFCFFTSTPFETAQKLILQPKLDTNAQKYLNDALGLYKQYLKTPEDFFGNIDELQEQITKFIENMKSRLTMTKMIVHQHFKMWVLQNDSLEILKKILSFKIKDSVIEYVSSPKYQFTIYCENETEHQTILNEFLMYIEETKLQYKIKFELDESHVVKDQEFMLRPLNMTC